MVGSARTACRVATEIGKNAATKVMNTMPASSVGSTRIATGTRAMAGMGRSTSVRVPTVLVAIRERPNRIPTGTPTPTASAKPAPIRISDWPRSR